MVTLRRVVSETKIWTLLGVHIWKVVVLASRWTGVRVEEVIVTLTRPLLGSVVDMSTVTEEQSAGVEGGGGKRGRDKRGERREERKSRKACDILLLHVRFCVRQKYSPLSVSALVSVDWHVNPCWFGNRTGTLTPLCSEASVSTATVLSTVWSVIARSTVRSSFSLDTSGMSGCLATVK